MLRLFSLFLALAVGTSATFAQHPAERQFASRVSQESLRTNVRSLVRLGNRWGGTSSGDKAADFVASRFRRFGLEVEVIEDPPRLVYEHSGWTLKVASPTRLRRLIRHEWLAGYSPSVPVSGGTLVDLESDPSATDLMGAVVLTERFVPGELYDDLLAQGAAAILSFAPADSDSYSDWSLITHLSAREDNPIPLFNLSFRNGMRLRKELAGGTEIRIEFSATTKVGPGSPKTVIGTLRGSSDTSRIICAHGDSDAGGPGADDNASGVAGVLELAGTFSRMVTDGSLPAPRENIMFIVWGSEYYSTEYFVKGLSEDIHRIASVINFDEIGFGSARNCVYFESNDIPQNEGLLRVLNAVGEDYAGKRGFWGEATTNPSQGGTDSYVFFPEYLEKLDVPPARIPSVTIYTAAWNRSRTILQTPGWTSGAWKGHPDSVTIDFSPYYHSSRDIPALTTEKEPFNMVWAVKAAGIALIRLAW